MARIKLASYLESVSGLMGDVVYVNRYGRQHLRVHVKPGNPNTAAQRALRRTFGDAVRSWQVLSKAERDRWNRLARKLPLSGYNLFISRFMRERTVGEKGRSNRQAVPGNGLSLEMIPASSVSAASPPCFGVVLPYILPGNSPGKG